MAEFASCLASRMNRSRTPCRLTAIPSWQHLQRHLPVHRVLPRLVHHPHAAAADLAAEGVVAEGAEGGRLSNVDKPFQVLEDVGSVERILGENSV